MSFINPASNSLRQCARGARLRPTSASPSRLYYTPTSRRCFSLTSNRRDAAADPRINGIVDQISQLTLLETADLVALLKSRLNIPDMPLASFAAAPAAAPAAEAAEEDAAPVKAAKALFNLKLMSFEATSKPKVIKEVKSLLGLSLVESKKFAESAPKTLKENLNKEEAETIVKAFEALGAKVTME